MANPVLNKTYVAGAAINPFTIVKYGTDDNTAIQAAAATDTMFGVANALGAASGERVDIGVIGIVDVVFGAAVTRGAKVTADANGKAVAAAPAAGSNAQVIGVALVSAASGDIGPILLSQSVMQG